MTPRETALWWFAYPLRAMIAFVVALVLAVWFTADWRERDMWPRWLGGIRHRRIFPRCWRRKR